MSDIDSKAAADHILDARDVDIVALRSDDSLDSAQPLPEGLRAARDRVARDFSLSPEWLNPGPTDLLVDQGPGKHEEDLRALSPTEEELPAAARWSRSHDPSEGYARVLRNVLTHLGVEHADRRT